MNETYKDAKLLAMGILIYINAVDEQGGNVTLPLGSGNEMRRT